MKHDAHALVRTNPSDGGVWTSALNPIFDKHVSDVEDGTSYKKIENIIVVNPDSIHDLKN